MQRMTNAARHRVALAGLAGLALLAAVALLRPTETTVAAPSPASAPQADVRVRLPEPASWRPRVRGEARRDDLPAPPLAVERELTRMLGIRYAACDLPAGVVPQLGFTYSGVRRGAVQVQGRTAYRVYSSAGEELVVDANGALLGQVRWWDAVPGELGRCTLELGVATVTGSADPPSAEGRRVVVCGVEAKVQPDGGFSVIVPAPGPCFAFSDSAGFRRLEVPLEGVTGLDLHDRGGPEALQDPSGPSPWGVAQRAWSRYRGYAEQVTAETFVPQHFGEELTDDLRALAWTYHYGAISPETRAWLATVIDPSAPPPTDPRTELPTSRERQIRAVWNTAEYLGAPVPHW